MCNDTITFNRINLAKLDIRFKALDDFINFYEWGVYDCGFGYILKDLQTGEILEFYLYENALIDRIVSRALDYELDEEVECMDYDENTKKYVVSKRTYQYYEDLFTIASQYCDKDIKWTREWLDKKAEFMRDLQVKESDK